MKTLEKTNDVYVYTEQELKEKTNKIIDKIQQYADFMDYRIVGNIDSYKNANLSVNNLSKNQLKKINMYLNSLDKKMTMRKINSFLNLFYKTFELTEKVQIKKSEKEEKIQKARKEWLKLRDEAEKALKIYKDEKGDYYKKQNLFTL